MYQAGTLGDDWRKAGGAWNRHRRYTFKQQILATLVWKLVITVDRIHFTILRLQSSVFVFMNQQYKNKLTGTKQHSTAKNPSSTASKSNT